MVLQGGWICLVIGTCVALTIFIPIVESSCRVTEFGSDHKIAHRIFYEGGSGSLKAKVSGKSPADTVYWKKWDHFISQDAIITPKFKHMFTLITNETTGLYELKFKNNLTVENAGVYKCVCGRSRWKIAVFVNAKIPNHRSTVKIKDETKGTGLPRVICGQDLLPFLEIDFHAGSIYPMIHNLKTGWTRIKESGESSTEDRMVKVRTEPNFAMKFNGVTTIFNYKGVTACFDVVADWTGPNRSSEGCTVIDVTSYDSCQIFVNDELIVNYSKTCSIPKSTIIGSSDDVRCQVTEFAGNRKAANYTFEEGEPGFLRAHVSGQRVVDSVYWKKWDSFLSQDSIIVPKYEKDFALITNRTRGLYELRFRNNLTAENAGVYKCTCENSHFDIAVFVNVSIPNKRSTVTINNENATDFPRVICGVAFQPRLQIDFDAGLEYPMVHTLKTSWTCMSKSGISSTESHTVPVTAQPGFGKTFHGVYLIFNYKGVRACFDVIADWNGPTRSNKGCRVIDITSYDSCRIFVNDELIVNYTKNCSQETRPGESIVQYKKNHDSQNYGTEATTGYVAVVMWSVVVVLVAILVIATACWCRRNIYEEKERRALFNKHRRLFTRLHVKIHRSLGSSNGKSHMGKDDAASFTCLVDDMVPQNRKQDDASS